MSPMAVDLLTGVLRPLHARAWDVQADSAGLEKLRELNRRHPLVFLPSHRSYADPLLLADVLAEHDFPRNHVLGGDNLRFWPVGPLAKRAGIVFIRRSFGDDEVYKLAVREYFGFLLAKRFNLEWYMEGGRSRTGKLRAAAATGCWRTSPTRWSAGRVDDVFLVPVSITYDQLREVSAMAAEQVGAAKKGEGLSLAGPLRQGAAAARSGQRHVRLRRADLAAPRRWRPAPTRTTRTRAGWPCRRSPSRSPWGSTASPRSMATALVTLALLGVRDRALTLGQVQRVLEPVRDYVTERGPAALRRGAAHRGRGAPGARGAGRGQKRGHRSTPAARSRSTRSSAASTSSPRSTATAPSTTSSTGRSPSWCCCSDPADRWDEAVRLRDLLKFEFFFPDRDTYREQLAGRAGAARPGVGDRRRPRTSWPGAAS